MIWHNFGVLAAHIVMGEAAPAARETWGAAFLGGRATCAAAFDEGDNWPGGLLAVFQRVHKRAARARSI